MIEYRNASIPGPIYGCSRGLSVRRLSVVLAVAANIGPGLVPCRAGWKEEIGFTLPQSRVGPGTPTGAGITVAQIETSIGIGVNYLPDSTDPRFVDKNTKTLSIGTGASSHATTAGKYYSGLSISMGPSIRLVNVCEANDWCAQGVLNLHSVSILVTWYRLITADPGVPRTLTPSLANINPRPLTYGEPNG